MNGKMVSRASAVLLFHFPILTWACGSNEYEQCVTVNLLVGTYKDCKCLPKGGDLGKITEPIKAESAKIIENIRREAENAPQAIQSCLSDVNKCVVEVISAPLAAPVQAYIEGLYRQSEGRSYNFSNEFIALAQPHFSVDLRSITWANDINTGSGMSVSYCDRIFFAGHGNLWTDPGELSHVLHEIEHTVQCQNRGKRTYLAEYVLKVGMDVLKTGRFDVHDLHDYEVAANAKASRITPIIWAQIQNGAPQPQQMIVQNQTPTSVPLSAPGAIPALNIPMTTVQYCRTAWGVCQFQPVLAPVGTTCHCGPDLGTAF